MKTYDLRHIRIILLWLTIFLLTDTSGSQAQIRNSIQISNNQIQKEQKTTNGSHENPSMENQRRRQNRDSKKEQSANLDSSIINSNENVQSIRYNENAQLSLSYSIEFKCNNSDISNREEESQYELYRNVIRKNLWLEGQGEPITQEIADKLPYYFRLSMKNKKGHYQFVESLHGKELSSDHEISPYILYKKNMSELDSTSNIWDMRFATIGQWLITSDLDGDKVVEERAYEAKSEGANLIYAFQPIYTDNHHVTGSYTDSWGLPIDINESYDHNYGSVVYVTLNSQGLDSIVDHIDSMGMCRYNEYGVDQTRYQFDNQQRVISITSHNTVGDPIKDERGICGTLFEYDDNNNTCTITHVDDYLRPVLYDKSSTLENSFSKALLKYDKFGRRQELINMDPDESKKSFQTLKYEYTDTGILVDISLK